MPDLSIQARPAFAGLMTPGRHGRTQGEAGVTLREVEGLGMASVIARKGRAADCAAALRRALALDLPVTPRCAGTGDLRILWAGPGQWMARGTALDSDALAERLAQALGGSASVAAQGDGRAVLRIGGPRARDTLAKGLALDLHESVFKPGDVALTSIMHMGVHFWEVDAAPTYEIALFRSFAGSFWHWIAGAAAEFGCEVEE